MRLLILLIILLLNSAVFPSVIIKANNTPSNYYALNDSLIIPRTAGNHNNITEHRSGNMFYYNTQFMIQDDFQFIPYFNNLKFLNGFSEMPLESQPLLYKSTLDLSKAMQMKYSFIKKNELGTFGKILGGALGVSAIGLGVYHLIKYKDDYFK